MPTRVISTSIKLDGEAEFKKQLSEANRELKNVSSEMKLLTAEFNGQANSMDYLSKKGELLQRDYDQQKAKAEGLAARIKLLEENNLGASKAADDYRATLNKTKAAMIELEREMKDNNRYLDEAKRSSDGAARSIDGFGREVKEASGDMDSMGAGVKGFLDKVGGLKTAIAGGAIVGGALAVKDAVMDIVESTEEYRKIMGTLETSSQNAGYNAEQTSEAYERLYGVLGDTQTAATTVANLQAIGLSQEDLISMIDATTGAWSTYGDSIPIDQLAESINLASQQSEVSLALADAIEWAGGNTEEFAKKLEEANSAEERGRIILQELKTQGLDVAGQGWRDANEDIVKMNEAQADWEAATGRLGEVLAPAATALVNFGSEGVQFVTDLIIGASEAIEDFIGWFQEMSQKVDAVDEWSGAPTWGYDGSHAGGLSYVPYDGYIAQLHKGETVLTANEAANLRALMADPGRVRQGVSVSDLQTVVATAVNAVAANQNTGRKTTIELNMIVNGKKFYQETIDDLRFVEKSNPEARSDA